MPGSPSVPGCIRPSCLRLYQAVSSLPPDHRGLDLVCACVGCICTSGLNRVKRLSCWFGIDGCIALAKVNQGEQVQRKWNSCKREAEMKEIVWFLRIWVLLKAYLFQDQPSRALILVLPPPPHECAWLCTVYILTINFSFPFPFWFNLIEFLFLVSKKGLSCNHQWVRKAN